MIRLSEQMSSPVGTETKELRSAFLTIIIRAEREREKVNVREKERKNPNKQSRYAGEKKMEMLRRIREVERTGKCGT